MTMLLLKRSNVALDRDVIFLAESGEEGSSNFGIDFMVAQHFDEIDAEFALAEGGSAVIENGRVAAVKIQTTEKVPRRARLVATGTSGHGSVPRLDNAVVHLSAAVAKVGTWETPMHLNETTRAYFDKLAAIRSPEQAARYRSLLQPQPPAAEQRYLAEREPEHYSMLRTSVVPTMLKAGIGINVIPSEAEATLDIRALPEEDMGEFFQDMARVINDPAVKIVPIASARPAGKPSRLDTDAYRALEKVSSRIFPGAVVLPTMSTGATDMAQLRAKGVQAYGIGPASTAEDTTNFGAHSDVERLSEMALYQFVQLTWNAVLEIAAHK